MSISNEIAELERMLTAKMLLDPVYIENNLAEFTGEGKIHEYLGCEVKIKSYSELKGMKGLNELIPSKVGVCILLIENEPNSGHWVALLKYDNNVEFFNSYGDPPAHEVRLLSDATNESLNQCPRDILNILDHEYSEGKRVMYNAQRRQKVSGDIGTCGKHCILRAFMLEHYGLGLGEYLTFIDFMASRLGVDADALVTLLIDV